jgi:hypothetical protein
MVRIFKIMLFLSYIMALTQTHPITEEQKSFLREHMADVTKKAREKIDWYMLQADLFKALSKISAITALASILYITTSPLLNLQLMNDSNAKALAMFSALFSLYTYTWYRREQCKAQCLESEIEIAHIRNEQALKLC